MSSYDLQTAIDGALVYSWPYTPVAPSIAGGPPVFVTAAAEARAVALGSTGLEIRDAVVAECLRFGLTNGIVSAGEDKVLSVMIEAPGGDLRVFVHALASCTGVSSPLTIVHTTAVLPV